VFWFEVGSPNVSEIELSRRIEDGWAGLMNWLQKLDLLRAAGGTCFL